MYIRRMWNWRKHYSYLSRTNFGTEWYWSISYLWSFLWASYLQRRFLRSITFLRYGNVLQILNPNYLSCSWSFLEGNDSYASYCYISHAWFMHRLKRETMMFLLHSMEMSCKLLKEVILGFCDKLFKNMKIGKPVFLKFSSARVFWPRNWTQVVSFVLSGS